MELDNFLNQGKTYAQPFNISQRLCLFLKMAGEDFLQGLMGNSNPCVHDASEGKFSVLVEAHANLSPLTIIFDGISEKIIEELVEFIFHTGNPHWVRRNLNL